MNKQMLFIFLVALSFASLMACSKTKSSNVKTSGIHVTYSIDGNNQNSVSCSATFQVGGATGTYLDLTDGDSVTCNGNSMLRSEFLGMVTYSATVPYAVGSTYTLIFSRTDESPYSSSVILPEAIVGINPVSLTNYTKGTALSPTWTPSTSPLDYLSVTLSFDTGDHSESFTQNDSSPENGIVGFSSANTTSTPPMPGTWNGSLKFTRVRNGTLSTSLAGSITAYQRHTTPITLSD